MNTFSVLNVDSTRTPQGDMSSYKSQPNAYDMFTDLKDPIRLFMSSLQLLFGVVNFVDVFFEG
jgi:hypothetical protein